MADSEVPYRTMRELSGDERPRERLLRHGAEVLGDAELLAILLGSGLSGENVLDLSRRVIASLGGLVGLARSDAAVLRSVRGLGPARAAQVAAAIELGRRVQYAGPDQRPTLGSPESVAALIAPRTAGKAREELYVLALDSRSRLLGPLAPVLQGAANLINVRPAEVFREAVLHHAVSVILVHNHPSGDPRPSPADVRTTRALIDAGQALDIVVHDHVIVAGRVHLSMRREGYAFPH